MATVCVDPDDFTTDTNGRLRAKLGCGLAHSNNGIILASAQARSIRVQEIQDTDILVPTSGDSLRVTPIAQAVITNPSDCRNMLVQVIEEAYHEVQIQPDGEVLIYHERSFDGGDLTVTRVARHHVENLDNPARWHFGDRHNVTQFRTVVPGGSLTVRFNLRAQHLSDAANTIFTYGTVAVDLLGVLV